MGLGTHSYGFQHLRDTGVYFPALFPSGGAKHELQIGFDAPVCQQLEILEYNAYGTPQEGNVSLLDCSQIETASASFPFQEFVFRGDGADDGGFSGAHLPYDVHEVSGHYVHIQSVEDDVFPVEDICSLKMYKRFHKNNSKIIQI